MNLITKFLSFFKDEQYDPRKFEQYILTEWYPQDIKPVRDGIYQVQKRTDFGYRCGTAYWDLKEWCSSIDIDKALDTQDWEWRGIKK